MTPLFRTPEPDDRPTAGEVAIAVGIAALVIVAFWLDGILKSVTP